MYRFSATQFRFAVGFVLMFVLASVLLDRLFKNEDDVLSITLESTASTFANKAMLIHAQWLMTAKTNPVQIKQKDFGKAEDYERVSYHVNKYGWPDVVIEHNACARLWLQMTGINLKLINKPLFAIEIKDSKQPDIRICRYHLNAGEYIEYNSRTGQIIKKN